VSEKDSLCDSQRTALIILFQKRQVPKVGSSSPNERRKKAEKYSNDNPEGGNSTISGEGDQKQPGGSMPMTEKIDKRRLGETVTQSQKGGKEENPDRKGGSGNPVHTRTNRALKGQSTLRAKTA